MIPNLDKSDIERPRTQGELSLWVKGVHRAFGRTVEGRRAVRLNQGDFIKQFIEEVWPLSLFAEEFYKGRFDVLFKPTIGSQSHDALILDANDQRITQYLQITQAFDGYQNHLRMEHVEEYGHAPVTGAHLRKDPSTKCVGESWAEVVPHDDLLRQTFEDIQAAVKRKANMRYESKTSLIVEFEDRHIRSDADRDALGQFAHSCLASATSTFDAVYLVSSTVCLAVITH